MIYNLVQYLRNKLVGETIYANHVFATVPDRYVLVIEHPGISTAWFGYVTDDIQILVRAEDMPKCRKLSFEIYELINSKFGLTLPTATVDSIIYNELQTAQISANNQPQSIGIDESGLPKYSTNYRVIYKE